MFDLDNVKKIVQEEKKVWSTHAPRDRQHQPSRYCKIWHKKPHASATAKFFLDVHVDLDLLCSYESVTGFITQIIRQRVYFNQSKGNAQRKTHWNQSKD